MKLQNIGIKGIELDWFRRYLTERTQSVLINNITSDRLCTKCGVPQGTVLGPLLFIIYINNIISAIKSDAKTCLNLFADDTLVAIEDCDIYSAVHKLNLVLNDINVWFKSNNLIINTDKTKVMLLGSIGDESTLPDVILNGSILEKVTRIRYLGVHIDRNLDFGQHAEEVIKSVTKTTNYFIRSAKSLNIKGRIDIYKGIVEPNYKYCPTIMMFVNRTNIKKLQVQQNRAMRFMLKCNSYTPVNLMLDCLRLLSVGQYYAY